MVRPTPHLFFGSFRINPVVTLVDQGEKEAPGDSGFFGTDVTFSDMNFGKANNLREMIAVILTPEDTPSGVIIGGVTADIHDGVTDAAGDNTGVTATIASARVPGGTSGDVVISGINEKKGAYVALYRAAPLVNRTPHATATNQDDLLSLNLNTKAGGFLIAGGAWTSTGSVSQTGVTEDVDKQLTLTADQVATGHAENLSADETPRTVTLDGPSGHAAGVAVSWKANFTP